MSGQDTEDFGAGNLSEKSRMLPSLPPYDMDDQLLPRERRSTWCCLAWTLLVATINLLVFLMNLLLMFVIFTIVLLPTIVVVYFGFQCHSQVSKPCSIRLQTATSKAGPSIRVLWVGSQEQVYGGSCRPAGSWWCEGVVSPA